ncbi:heat-shock protein Hsp70 [Mesobaculum littorinae]|uniref:Heat-shock protein Hsp70 n=1 Tax=Mesobaculum littorinae TaxID=2486419 RepID=A0A438AJY3_9RHOB|nr:heat-shock protein Hsp70 [Mesobaculum littorinae]
MVLPGRRGPRGAAEGRHHRRRRAARPARTDRNLRSRRAGRPCRDGADPDRGGPDRVTALARGAGGWRAAERRRRRRGTVGRAA